MTQLGLLARLRAISLKVDILALSDRCGQRVLMLAMCLLGLGWGLLH